MAEDHDHEHDHSHAGHDHAHEHDHEHDPDHVPDSVDGAELSEEQLERRNEQIRRHALSQIRQYPDVALRMKAKEVTQFDEFLMQLVERMIHLMGDAQGVGLAATQLGILQRIFVFDHEESGAQAVVNPRIAAPSTEKETDEEGCLSLERVRVPVERSTKVTLEGVNPEGEELRFELEGLAARVVQHELDHLDGLLIIDRTDDEHRKQALALLRPQAVLRS